MSKGFAGMKTPSRRDSLRLDELVDMVTFPDKQWVILRFLETDPLHVRQAWIKIFAGREEKREITIPRFVVNFDPNNPSVPKKGIRCPYSELATGEKDSPVRVSDFWLMNAIDRDKQEEGPPRRAGKPTKEERTSGFKDIRSDSWTPVRVVRVTSTMVARMQELSEDNIKREKGSKKQYDATHPEHGFDVRIKYKKDAPGTDKYSIDKVDGGGVPLTAEEKKYLVWDLREELLDMAGRLSEEQALEDIKRMEIVGDIPHYDDDDKPSRSRRSRSLDDDDDEDDKPVRKKKKRSSLDDDDDDKPVKKKGKRPFDDDDDDKPVRKKKRSSLDDDDDDDDKPVRKKSSVKSSSKPAAKSKRSSIDDDDEDDKPVRKKSSVKRSSSGDAPVKKKKTSSTSTAPVKKKVRR